MPTFSSIIEDFKKQHKVIAVSAFLLLIALVLVKEFFEGVALNLTNSVPGTVFIQVPDKDITRESYVLIPAQGGFHSPTIKHFTKFALCISGDTLSRVGLKFYCNGEFITEAKLQASSGEPLEAFTWDTGTIPEGMFFAGSSYPDGYDSRYFGFVAISDAIVMEKIL